MNASHGLPADGRLGRYEIVAELGTGAMGTVYKAHDPLLERTVALKTISLAVSANEMAEYEARFYQEAKAAGSLNHPNIVTVYDVGKTGSVPYLAMEHLEGSELQEIMRHTRPLPAAHAVEIAAQVADGLAYAHERGVVHRDVKPANIMIVREGRVKIADFGVARMRSSRGGSETQIVGSPRYMSPEQALRKRAEHRSDIFALGVVLYEMLTGAPPFTGADLNSIMFQIVHAELRPPSLAVAELPHMLDSIVSKALAKAPEDRYQSARALAADLRECRRRMPETTTLAQLALPERGTPKRPADLEGTLSGPSTAEDARQGERAADEQARTLGPGDFDALSTTARLAAEVGVPVAVASSSFDRVVETSAPQTPGGAFAAGATPQRSVRGDATRAWSATQRFLFGAVVAIAALVAMLIVFA